MSCILFSRSSYETLIDNSDVAKNTLQQFEGRVGTDGKFSMSWAEWLFNLNVAAYRERYFNVPNSNIEEAATKPEIGYEFGNIEDWNDPKVISDLFGCIAYQCSEFNEHHPNHASVEMLAEIRDAIKARMASPAYVAKADQAQEQQRAQRQIEVARIAERLRAKYPRAKVGHAAVNLRAELKDIFPGVKFKVRSYGGGGGNSVSVSYSDGPPLVDVEAIANQYVGGDFDSAFGEAFEIVCGRARYVHVEREYSAGAMQIAVDANADRWGRDNAFEVKTSHNGHGYVDYDRNRELQRRELFDMLRATDFRS